MESRGDMGKAPYHLIEGRSGGSPKAQNTDSVGETADASKVDTNNNVGYNGNEPDFYVVPNKKILPNQYKDWLGENQREKILSSLEDPFLQQRVGELYRPGSIIGDGGTADILRFERKTGILLSSKGHIQKANVMYKYFQKLIDSGTLTYHDEKIIRNIIDDLKTAIEGD